MAARNMTIADANFPSKSDINSRLYRRYNFILGIPMTSIEVRAGFALVEISMSLHLGGGKLFSNEVVDG